MNIFNRIANHITRSMHDSTDPTEFMSNLLGRADKKGDPQSGGASQQGEGAGATSKEEAAKKAVEEYQAALKQGDSLLEENQVAVDALEQKTNNALSENPPQAETFRYQLDEKYPVEQKLGQRESFLSSGGAETHKDLAGALRYAKAELAQHNRRDEAVTLTRNRDTNLSTAMNQPSSSVRDNASTGLSAERSAINAYGLQLTQKSEEGVSNLKLQELREKAFSLSSQTPELQGKVRELASQESSLHERLESQHDSIAQQSNNLQDRDASLRSDVAENAMGANRTLQEGKVATAYWEQEISDITDAINNQAPTQPDQSHGHELQHSSPSV